MSMLEWMRWLSKHGKVHEKKRAEKQNWKAVRSTICRYAREGRYYAYYHEYLYDCNRYKLIEKGFEVEKQQCPLGSVRWKISWEET